MPNLTPAEDNILRSALGLRYADKPYRNYFSTHPGADNWKLCTGLVEKGLMLRAPYRPGSPPTGLITFGVSDAGFEQLGLAPGSDR